jgi:hypothetical protein
MPRESSRKTAIVAVLVLVVGGVAVFISQGNPQKPIGILYEGTFATAWPGAPRPRFVITNQSGYRIAWTVLGPEFREGSGWTTVQIPNVRFGGETLAAHASFEIYGIPATNVAYRYAVLWGLQPADALSRPKWKRVVDAWFERARLRPPFLPHGVERGPVIPPQEPNPPAAGNAGL